MTPPSSPVAGPSRRRESAPSSALDKVKSGLGVRGRGGRGRGSLSLKRGQKQKLYKAGVDDLSSIDKIQSAGIVVDDNRPPPPRYPPHEITPLESSAVPPTSPTSPRTNTTTNPVQRQSSLSSGRGRADVSQRTTESRQNMTRKELSSKYKYLRDYFIFDNVVKKTKPNGKISCTHTFKCVLCRPKECTLQCSYDTLANLKRHITGKHAASLTKYLIASVVKKKGLLEEKEGEEDVDESDDDVAGDEKSQPGTSASQKREKSVKDRVIYREKKIKDTLVDFFVSNFISLRVVESPSFNKMMQANNSGHKPMSRRNLMRLVGERHHWINDKLKK